MQLCIAALSSWVQAGLPVSELPATLQAQMMSVLEATGLIVVSLGTSLCAGQTPPPNVLIGLQAWIESRLKGRRIYTTREGPEEYPQLAGFAEIAAGILSIPLSDDNLHYAVWFRPAIDTTTSTEGIQLVPLHNSSLATSKEISQRSGLKKNRCRPSKAWSADCIYCAHILATILQSHLAYQNLRQYQASIRLHEEIYDCSAGAMLVTDANNIIQKANPAFTILTGYHTDEVLGNRPSILKSGYHGTHFYSDMCRTINTTGKWQGDIWNRHKSGELRAHTLSIRTLYNKDGTAWRRIGLITDVTEHKQAVTALWESEMRWQFAVECNGGAMWDWNMIEDELFATVAAAAVLDLPKNTKKFQIADLVHRVIPEDQPKVQAAINNLISGKSSELQIEFRVSPPGKSLRWISTRGRVMTRNGQGMPERVVSISKDVTQNKIKEYEHKNQTELLSQRARLVLIGEMASIFAHEINQPLAAIAALAAGCKRKAAGLPEAHRLVEAIEEQAMRGGDIAWRMLDFSRRRRSSGRCAVSLAELVSKIPSWISLQHSKAEITVDIGNISKSLPSIYAAPVEIEQVLLNLVRNAIDAGVSNSKLQRVVISAQFEDNAHQVEVRVTDWGCGLPDIKLFSRLKPFESNKDNGTGLGLTVCISIIQAHGGRIWATANPEGGTIVHFTVPLFDHSYHGQSVALQT